MENSSHSQSKIFKGAGWLLGIAISIVGAMVVFIFSDSFAAAISAALPIGIFAGIGLDQKFQRENERVVPKKTKMMIGSLLFGFITFVVFYIILHF
ncbi:hypothetical protein [Flagellimonas sediminis]|uniref:Uncharacterized protein n=1 Tax=Flagellimonas sediminis TaxID=2696468 RepID=A0A6I5KY70_9FLAO|nr:hypothetical protein [Allomuricauda sediminis]NDV42888.1 hypothetical protein [Allomuricauda sediminis]